MDTISKLNIDKFKSEITQEDIRPIQIITIALNSGLIIFLGIILYLYSSKIQSPDTTYGSTLNIFFFAMIIFFFVSIFTSRIMSKKVLLGTSDAAHQTIDTRASAEKNAFALYKTHHIIKLALLEGSTLFGLVVLLLAVLSGAFQNSSLYWLGLIPFLYMLFISYTTFPTKERIIEVLREARNELELR